MTPPQEQAMTDTEQPSQWARGLWERARFEYFHGDPFVCRDERAVLLIQRVIAEREAELVGVLKAIDEIVTSNVRENVGPDRVRWDGVWHEGPLATAYLQTLLAFQELTTAALKSREAGHG